MYSVVATSSLRAPSRGAPATRTVARRGGPRWVDQHNTAEPMAWNSKGKKTGHAAKKQKHRMVENSYNSNRTIKVHGAAHAPS